ncbi:MAG: glycosyltransferase family 2 protein [Deltaproteobacteria bacterium]|nr:glycosyltransferase family 2 protein [Deltaproteobacteria bacterium]
MIARNEERAIERCLRSLAFADERVVVDAGSTDRTVELARACGAKVVSHDWAGFARQRNVGLENCSGEWVFFLDADEEASPQLAARLRAIAGDAPEKHPACYSIRRDEFFLGRELRFGPGNPSHQWRFFKRAGVRFEGEVHEFPRFEGPVGLVDDAAISHWPDLGIDKFLTKLNHYTTLEALDRFAQGQRTTLFHAAGTFFTTFLKNGIRYRGLWNGKEGFVLTVLESFSRVVRHLKLWVFWQVHEGKLKLDLGLKLPRPGSARPLEKAELEPPVWKPGS